MAVIIVAGYEGKRFIYERMKELGIRQDPVPRLLHELSGCSHACKYAPELVHGPLSDTHSLWEHGNDLA